MLRAQTTLTGSERSWAGCGACLFLAVHALLVWGAARRQSPVWDEIVYPAAGYDLLTTGQIRTSFDHPPLGKILLAWPLLLGSASLHEHPSSVDAFRFGFDFVDHNTNPPLHQILAPRLACLAISLLLGGLIFIETRRRWGLGAGLCVLGFYAWSPPVLAHASLALLDLPLTFWLALSAAAFYRWRASSNVGWIWLWVLAWTCALLTKITAVVFLPLWLFLAFENREERRRLLAGLFGAWTFCETALRLLKGGSWTALAFLRHTDLAASRFPVYFMGRFWDVAPRGAALTAWLFKMPLAILGAGLLAGFFIRRSRSRDPLLLFSFGVLALAFALMVGVRSIIATGHYLFLYPFLLWMIGAGYHAAPVRGRRWFWFLSLLLACETASVYPDVLSFFNGAVGGSTRGRRWLADSDQDWGQGLPLLAGWMRSKSIDHVLLAYAGAGDPRVYGIHYQDVLSPALISATYRGEIFAEWPRGIYFAVGTKVLQSEKSWLGWLDENRRPMARLGGSVLIFNLTGDSEALNWLCMFYDETHRPREAAALRKFISIIRNRTAFA